MTTAAARRVAWAILAVLLAAALVFEIARHLGATLWTAPLGLILPDLAFLVGIGRPHEPGRLPAVTVPLYNLLHRVWAPLAILIIVSADGQTADEGAPYFVLGLAWLLHIAADRSLGFGLRSGEPPSERSGRRGTSRPRSE